MMPPDRRDRTRPGAAPTGRRRTGRPLAVLLSLATLSVVAVTTTQVSTVLPALAKAKGKPPAPPPPPPAVGGQTAGAADVRAHGARGDGTGDDTAAFLAAQDSALSSTVRYPTGPGGAPQAAVYVPPGTYRLLRLVFRSNVRMEVDAAAVLEQAGGRNVSTTDGPPPLILWDGPGGAPLTNVTLIGVNQASGGLKSLADPVFPGWSLGPDFTFNLDPAATDANAKVTGIHALNVDGFLIRNVYSIQNDSQPATVPTTGDWWPQSSKAALGLRERSDTPADGSVYYDPHNGTVGNWYNIRSPKGYGPNQVNAAHNVRFEHIFSQGGTTMRFETDASQGKAFASELRGVTADDVAGRNCNRAVSLAPHAQLNYDVHVTRVQASSCAQGVIESIDETNSFAPGAFVNSTISDVSVTGGSGAQNAIVGGGGLWTVGTSQKAFFKDNANQAPWSVVYGNYSCKGAFQAPPDLIMTASGLRQPVCAP